ncbi:MAG: hypothetical protein WCL26_02370 [Actinomycetes bacterium]
MSNQVETIINVQIENRDKTTVFLRGILVAPVLVFIATFTQSMHLGWSTGLIVLPALLALVVRGIYPSYVLSFNHSLMELQTRAFAYLFLLTDDYPSIERNPNVAVLLPDVDGGRKLNRGLPLVKWFLAIPLYIVGFVYTVLALLASVVAWVITWSTGKYPTWALTLVLGTMKFWNRVYGYALILVTDEYPSFSL